MKFHPLAVAPLGIDLTLGGWVADALLVVFFFIVAAELKNELTLGQLNTPRKAAVPLIGAVFGVAGPAVLYLVIGGGTAVEGWPIPTATDIAFALGLLAVFGRGLPSNLRVFLLALAVLDDLIGIILIAVLFSNDVNGAALAAAALLVVCFAVLARRLGRSPVAIGTLLGGLAVLCWYAVLQSGVHATLTGVALGLALPVRWGLSAAHHLQPWSNAIVLPLFAFSAALVPIPQLDELSPVFLALAVALPVGKAVGITIGGLLGGLLARRTGAARIEFGDLIAIAVTGGLGFTVALLMNQLAFAGQPQLMDQGALGVLTGSALSLLLGAALLHWRARVHRARGAGQGTAESGSGALATHESVAAGDAPAHG